MSSSRTSKRKSRFGRIAMAAVASSLVLTACSAFQDDASVLLRSDPPMTGYTGSMLYDVKSSPNGDGEINSIQFRGVNNASPMPLLTTTYGKGVNSNTQLAQITSGNGTAINVLSMNRWGTNVGLTDYLSAQVATYEQRDAFGNRVCGAKVRMDFKPNIAQVVRKDKYRRAWNTLFYYTIPCGDTVIQANAPVQDTTSSQTGDDAASQTDTTSQTDKPAQKTQTVVKPNVVLDFTKAKLIAQVVDQQTTPRVTGKPIFFNRGHSVTIVGGKAASYRGGWWQSPAGLLSASNLVIDQVKDLDKNDWLKFADYNHGQLVYSAGDADVYASLDRIFHDRQSSYLVNFRDSPNKPWKRVLVVPKYNYEWNDLKQNYKALKGQDMPDIDDMVDQDTGLPKDIDDPSTEDSKVLKEIETAGCQNCPNPTLEQIQFVDATDGSSSYNKPLYAMTIRGWLGSQSSLVMFGRVPDSVDSYMDRAEKHRQELGMTSCPVQRDENGKKLDDSQQYSKDDCARWLREGALWDMLTGDASKFGFDTVSQMRVRDNSTWASHCSGSGESTSCNLVPTERRMNAAYMFTDTGDKLAKSWTIMQLLGEVGMRTLGMSYASGAYDGSGMDFAMAQPQVYNSYFSNMQDSANPYNPELLFALDARALQLPQTLGKAGQYLGLQP